MTSPIDPVGSLFSIRCPACGMKVGKPCGHGSVGMYVCQARAEAVRIMMEYARVSERPPRQNTFGSLLYDKEGDLRLYCWCLESRVVTPLGEEVMGWSTASGSQIHPNHFRSSHDAYLQKKKREDEMLGSRMQDAIKFEYRVAPKYLGYVPAKDEQWLS